MPPVRAAKAVEATGDRFRAIIADGRWDSFRRAYLESRRASFATQLEQRLAQAVAEGRLDPAAAGSLKGTPAPREEVKQAA